MDCPVRDINIHYKVFGEGKPIIFIHGFGIDHHAITGCMEPIFENLNGWKRIYFDLPGMGKSESKPCISNCDIMLDLISQFIDKVIPDENFVLFGQSYGGYLARGLVRDRPDAIDGLFLLCPVIIPEHGKRTVPDHTPLVRDESFLLTLGQDEKVDFESTSVVLTEHAWKRTQNEIQVGCDLADQAFLTKFVDEGYTFSFDVDSLPTAFEAPTLIMTGRQDAVVGSQDALNILKNYPRATFAMLDRAGHNLQIEQETLFGQLVTEWLDRVEERSIQ
jgi:pimeloyl-ACP methyl ester carboxylesterase